MTNLTTATTRISGVHTLAEHRTAYRITSIDFLRGLVMIIMALDHTRDFIHEGALVADPLSLTTPDVLLFFTRWITHFCAPVFVFLAGTSAYLQGLRKSKTALSTFLIKRGLWLILVELTIVTLGISFDIAFNFFFLQVIWAIGISMVLLGLAVRLPFNAILVIGLLIVLGHNSLDFYEAKNPTSGLFYSLLHRQNFLPFGDGRVLAILYPFLPWTGLMLLGYCFGKLFTRYEGAARRKILLQLGLGILLFFVALRFLNVYGDPSPWATQKNAFLTTLSFINTTKYPPSLLFMCMTIGPAILFLAFADKAKSWFANVVTVYGKVPFFYYVLHFYLIHAVAVVFSLVRGHSFAEGAAGVPGVPFKFVFPGEGLSPGGTYLVWLSVVIALYPACRWFSRYKQTHKQWWLSYL
ncbi:MAG TPA: heparan-alpha-glucosaminide N-acetyltransferase domain-containing protein [Flavisolibacter sp.]|nr:heparan-alpha-glucosaminide N-acetyltransferase domain-containing protein [Flavisolibacter sp.]